MRKTEQMDKHESLIARHSELLAVFARGRSSPSATPRGIAHIRLNKKVGHIILRVFLSDVSNLFLLKAGGSYNEKAENDGRETDL